MAGVYMAGGVVPGDEVFSGRVWISFNGGGSWGRFGGGWGPSWAVLTGDKGTRGWGGVYRILDVGV